MNIKKIAFILSATLLSSTPIKAAEQELTALESFEVEEFLAIDEVTGIECESEIQELTVEEAQLLMRLATAEAGNQGVEGMRLVMSVVLNRVSSDKFPNSIKDVIYQKNAFSSLARLKKTEILFEAREALILIECGNIQPEIIGFEKKKSRKLRKYFKESFVFGEHRFYK